MYVHIVNVPRRQLPASAAVQAALMSVMTNKHISLFQEWSRH